MEDLSESLSSLDEGAWEALGRLAQCEGAGFLDLSRVEVVTPGGVVALLLMTRCRQRRFTSIELPQRKTPAYAYLRRIDLVHIARFWGSARFDTRNYDGAPPMSDTSAFTKTLIPGHEEHEQAFDLMVRYIDETYPARATELRMVFTELLNNITDHASGEGPFYCVQMHALPRGLQVSFGDLGVGFRASLGANPNLPPFESESDALHGAIVEELSGLSHLNPDRGGGLHHALRTVAELGGRYRVVSYDGTAASSGGPPTFGPLAHAFPGTLTWIDLPRVGGVR